jgi:hypothetical protein
MPFFTCTFSFPEKYRVFHNRRIIIVDILKSFHTKFISIIMNNFHTVFTFKDPLVIVIKPNAEHGITG